jgi:hypothetical protein
VPGAIHIADEAHELRAGDDDKISASTRNIARRNFLTVTSESMIRGAPRGCGDCTTTVMSGQVYHAVLERRRS